jgi:hypothetical protein
MTWLPTCRVSHEPMRSYQNGRALVGMQRSRRHAKVACGALTVYRKVLGKFDTITHQRTLVVRLAATAAMAEAAATHRAWALGLWREATTRWRRCELRPGVTMPYAR